MGLLVARIKILPQDVAIKPDQLLKDISDALLEGMAIRNSTEEPIAFGLVALIADIKFEDKEGSMEELENLLNSIENISQIEVKAVSKLSTSV
jgi:elongation factor 1-beta